MSIGIAPNLYIDLGENTNLTRFNLPTHEYGISVCSIRFYFIFFNVFPTEILKVFLGFSQGIFSFQDCFK
jgi:hypothetical protein